LRAQLITFGVLIGILDFNDLHVPLFGLGVVMMAVAAWIHVWAKGHLQQNAALTRSGPYRWVRDPFYISNFFMDLGLCLIINNGIFTVVFMIFWAIAYRHQMGAEDEKLLELFGDDYREYRDRIPRMIPYKRPMDKQYDKPFSVKHPSIYKGLVCTRMLRVASYPYLLTLAAWIGDYGQGVLALDQHPFFYWALCAYVFFHVLAEAAARLTGQRASLLPRAWLRAPVPGVFAVVWIAVLWGLDHWTTLSTGWGLSLSPAALALTLAVGVALVLLGSRVRQSLRYLRLLEGLGLVFASLFTPLPWLAVVPASLYAIAFLYGDPERCEAEVDHVFPPGERAWPTPAWLTTAALCGAAATRLLLA